MKSWFIDLGTTDCDTCGCSWNELEIDYDPEDGWWSQLRVGCYGGGTETTLEGTLELLLRAQDILDSNRDADRVAADILAWLAEQ